MPIAQVLLVERMYLRREMYLSILLDRASGGPVLVASPAGGTSIEDVAAATPHLIFKHKIDIMCVPPQHGPFMSLCLHPVANPLLRGDWGKSGRA